MRRSVLHFDILSARPACQLSHTKFRIVESALFSLRGKVAPLAGIPEEAFDKILTSNVKSVLWLAGMTLEKMAQRAKSAHSGASFIVVGSIAGLLATPTRRPSLPANASSPTAALPSSKRWI
jgi:NAD(P)-dependent dehydrogenase (short-subunit alcohol dehydrogenase family)